MISAVILAAGESKRMGQPKLLLPWGHSTVIEHVVTTFLEAGVEDVLVVTGGTRQPVEAALLKYPVRTCYNQDFAAGEMLSSIQTGLRHLPDSTQTALIGLGDQPQVQARAVWTICQACRDLRDHLVVPSFQHRRGHPWGVARPLWKELLALRPPQTPRDFLSHFASLIHYVELDTESILADLDTPDDYRRERP